MKPFDLEAAKRGEPVEIYQPSDGTWWPALFVGVRKSGFVLLDSRDGYIEWEVAPHRVNELLRMAPKKVTWNCRILVRDGQPFLSKGAYPIEWPESLSGGGHWHGEPFTVEVEE